MKNKSILTTLFSVVLIVALTVLPVASAEEQRFNITHDTMEIPVNPIMGSKDAVSFYDYDPQTWSGYTPYMEENTSKIYLYKDTTTGNLSLIIHHGTDKGTTTGSSYKVEFNLNGMPDEAYVALCDDPNRGELNLENEPEGNWEFDKNKVDGGVIGLPNKEWCITIEPNFQSAKGITKWEYVNQDHNISLDMNQTITICNSSSGITLQTQSVQVDPIERDFDAVSFYDYDPQTWSGYTPYMEENTSKIYLYKDTTTGNLSLIIHHGTDKGTTTGSSYKVEFNLNGMPDEAYVALCDDPNRGELNLENEPEGNWEFDKNKVDGGVIGLPNKEWCITIEPNFQSAKGITKWEYVNQNHNISLDMNQPLTICDPEIASNTESGPSPTPTPSESDTAEPVPALSPVGLIALAGGLLAVALVMIRKK